jgi:hypothetical protein
VHKYYRTLLGTAAVAALGVAVMLTNAHFARAQDAPQKDAPKKAEKAVKDQQEFDIYNDVLKDASPPKPDPKKLLTDLDTWKQKYPTTAYDAERAYYYLQGYAGTNQPAKALDSAKDMFAGPLDALKADPKTAGMALQALAIASSSASAAASQGSLTPEELDTGNKAAHMMLDFANEFFAAGKKPAAYTDAQWAEGKKQAQDVANGALLAIALYPGNAIYKTNPKDPDTCAKAEPKFQEAQQQMPDSGVVTQMMATVSLCQQSKDPKKAQQAIYEFARAVGLPAGAPFGLDPAAQKTYDDYLKRVYTSVHGSEEGLAELKALALKSPLPPGDFHIKTNSEIMAEKEEAFRSKNPQLAAWMNIKGKLTDTNEPNYFEGQLKDAEVNGKNLGLPQGTRAIKGVVLGGVDAKGKPKACRPEGLLVAIPMPDQTGTPAPDITLRLVDEAGKPKPLADKPDTGIEIQFDGVPKEFAKEPFMLTMEADKTQIDGLKGTPCTVAAPPAKKGAPPAKKKG